MRSLLACGVLMVMSGSLFAADEATPPKSEQSKEHAFLNRFVGDWECDGEAYFDPSKPPISVKSKMAGSMIGDYWATVVVSVPADQAPYHGRGTFGYDTRKKKYVGVWTDSMSSHMALLEGNVDGNKLVVESESLHPMQPSKLVKFRDTWDFQSNDLLILTSHMYGDDGKMTLTMKATCKRTK